MLRISRRLAVLGLMAMTMAMAGCDDDDDPTAPANISGTYTLRTVNGSAPPVTLVNVTGYKLEIMSATITITGTGSSGTYSETTNWRETTNGVPDEYPETYTGTWTRSGNTVTFTDQDDDTSTATVRSDGAITFSENISGTTYTARFTK